MAKQKGIVKLEGTIGDITFVKTKDGYFAKEKTPLDGKRIASDPRFERTRENNAEFGTAGKASKVFMDAFRKLMKLSKDARASSRLTTQMLKVVKSDPVNVRGKRNVVSGDISILSGFDFNIAASFNDKVLFQYTTAIDRTTGTLQVEIPAYTPMDDLKAPDGATHYKMVSAAAEIDFQSATYISKDTGTDILPWDRTAVEALTLSHELTPDSNLQLYLLFGIQYFQEVNGEPYPLKTTVFNSLKLVALDKA